MNVPISPLPSRRRPILRPPINPEHPMNAPISPLPSWRRPILRPPINPEHPMNDPISPLPSWRRPILRPPINPEPQINKNDLPIISNRQPKGIHRPIPVNPLDLEQKRRRLKYLIDLNNLTNYQKKKKPELAPERIRSFLKE